MATNGTAEPTIRLATLDDVPTIFSMIMELAEFEKSAFKVKATEKSLAATLSFAPSPSNPNPKPGHAKCFFIIAPKSATAAPTTEYAKSNPADDAIAGMALFTYNYSTWTSQPGVYLEDLFVRPQYRRRGYAGKLFGALAREAIEVSGDADTRLKWTCLKWNEGALKFYGGLGARTEDEWYGLRVEGDAVRKLAEQ